MEVSECLDGRTSIRVFKSDPVDEKIVLEGLRLANQAPSAGNLQARDFVIVRELKRKRDLSEAAYRQDFVRTAPVVVVFCANLERIGHYGARGRELYCLQDVGAAVENFMLYLHGQGLGSVWVGAFDEKKVSRALGLPAHARPVAMVPLGYPADEGVRRKRISLEELVHRESW